MLIQVKKITLIFCIALIFSNCATLTKSQIESVNHFAKSSTNFSDYPSKIMEEMAEIRIKRGIYYANSLSDPKTHIDELDNIFEQWKFDHNASEKVDITFKIIDKYAQSLTLLSADKYSSDLEEQSEKFGINIDTLIAINNRLEGTTKIPVGIGASIGQLVVFSGKQYIRIKQAKEIKKFVGMADTLVHVMTNNLLEYLQSSSVNELIEGEEREITRNYLSYLQQSQKATIENEHDYIELKKKIEAVKELQQQTIGATIKLKKAHTKLLENLQKKKKLKDAIEEIQVLYEEIKLLKESIEKIERIKEE
jgi:hypothetical protein